MIPPILLDPYLTNPDRLGTVSREARLLYLLLGNEVDEFGRFDADPDALAAKLFPADEFVDGVVVSRWLASLTDKGFIDHALFHGESKAFIVGWLHAREAVGAGNAAPA